MDSSNCDLVGCFEIVYHVSSSPFISMVKNVLLWIHIPFYLVNFVSSVGTVIGHDDGTLKLPIDKVHVIAVTTLFDQGQAMVNRQELRYIVDDKIKTPLKYPRGREESRPSFYLVLENLGLFWHKESWVATNLAQS